MEWNNKPAAVAMMAIGMAALPGSVFADDREDLERLRATVLGLVETLVQNEVIPREKADAMMREAEARANRRLAQLPPPETTPDGKKIQRVAYVPEAYKARMRKEIKDEVLAETRSELKSGAITSASYSPVKWEGDVRIRGEALLMGGASGGNSSQVYLAGKTTAAGNVTRAPALVDTKSPVDTQSDTNRLRVRARLALEAALSDSVTAGLGVATGNSTRPTSTNQTLGDGGSDKTGDYFNKYSVVLDKAFINYKGLPWLSLTAGRFRNPFYGTDLVWADDLNFDGFSATLKPQIKYADNLFVTAGWFPLANSVSGQSRGRSLLGVQAGGDWRIGQKDNHIKLAAALYDYHGVEGVKESDAAYQATVGSTYTSDYGTRSAYASGYRQQGNTLFRLNAPMDPSVTSYWGLAASFRELDMTATVDVAHTGSKHVIFTGDYVKNLAFDRQKMASRSGINMADGKSYGFMGKLQYGDPQIAKRGDWNVSLAYRYLGSDAVLDAFTNSDFGLGGTNNKGFIVGGNFGVATGSWISARWLSSDLIDSMVPSTTAGAAASKYSTNVLQLDMNSRF
jgi:hypothetical protein